MALAYPEGECFFKTQGINSPKSGGYQATLPEHFYSHIMIEYVWNMAAHHDGSGKDVQKEMNEPKHPRCGYQRCSPKRYGSYQHVAFCYGQPSAPMHRYMRHNLCLNQKRFEGFHEHGASMEPWFMTMPMPTKQERWVWIDRTMYIRAIYIPVCHKTDEAFDTMCTMLQINLTARGSVQMWYQDTLSTGSWQKANFDSKYGLIHNRNYSLGLDIQGIISLLTLPRQMRTTNVFAEKLVHMRKSSHIQHSGSPTDYHDSYDTPWLSVANSNFGVELQWKPAIPNKPWYATLFKSIATTALGFVPGIGPLLSIAFDVGFTAITEPDETLDAFLGSIPGIADLKDLRDDLKRSSKESSGYISSIHKRKGKAFALSSSEPEGTPAPMDTSRSAPVDAENLITIGPLAALAATGVFEFDDDKYGGDKFSSDPRSMLTFSSVQDDSVPGQWVESDAPNRPTVFRISESPGAAGENAGAET